MNAERLLTHYEQIADAPNAIARLRRFILDLAVRGKLVPQKENEEPASELLKRITAEKARLVKTGEIKPPKGVPAHAGPPFPLPVNWVWSQLAEIGVLSPRNEAADNLKASFIPMPMIAAEYGVENQHEVRPWGEIKKGYTHFAEGDVGLAKITPCFENGKSTVFRNLTGGIGSGTTELHIVRSLFVDQDYILVFLKSPHFIETGISKMTGTAGQKRVPTDYFAHSPFPLPPLSEQHRIVAKVDELMALCDRLEAARTNRETTRDRLMAASLARLNGPDSETFEDGARFALDALSALTMRPDQIKLLRQTILNLAVRGKLVPQNPSDEPASELLKRIAEEKARLVKAGEIRKPKPLPAVDETPFDLPQNWRWTRIREVASDRGQEIPQAPFTYIDVTAIDKEAGVVADPKVLEASEAPSRARKVTRKGDVIYSCVRPYLLNVAVIDSDFDPEPIASTAFAILNGHGLVLPRYLWIVLRSPFMVECVEEYQRGQAYPAINDADFAVLPFPLPPLAEQHRIVAKVDELMARCDRLEASLTATAETRRRLLDALLAEALTPAEDRELEAAE